jgi:hypothetical protein
MPKGVYERNKTTKTRPNLSGNGDRAEDPVIRADAPYHTPTEIDARDIPAPWSRWGRWARLYQDIQLRLEKTPPHRALAYPFQDTKALKSAYDGLHRRLKQREDDDYIHLSTRSDPPTLYVRRGPQWKKGE